MAYLVAVQVNGGWIGWEMWSYLWGCHPIRQLKTDLLWTRCWRVSIKDGLSPAHFYLTNSDKFRTIGRASFILVTQLHLNSLVQPNLHYFLWSEMQCNNVRSMWIWHTKKNIVASVIDCYWFDSPVDSRVESRAIIGCHKWLKAFWAFLQNTSVSLWRLWFYPLFIICT